MPDKRALSILFETYWSSAGWKPDHERKVRPEDSAYARKQGVMFDALPIDHETILSRLANAGAKLTPRLVGDGFLASLSSRRLEWRSALGSYSVFKHIPKHKPAEPKQCTCCGLYLKGEEDLSVLNFERHKWGGVRHLDPAYAMLDLELFLADPPPQPTATDVAIFDALVAAIESAPSKTTSGNLHKFFPGTLKANKAERDTIVAILGFCGALGTKSHPGFADRFVPWDARAIPDRHFVDMSYPACWWNRSEGFDRSALKPYFGHASRAV